MIGVARLTGQVRKLLIFTLSMHYVHAIRRKTNQSPFAMKAGEQLSAMEMMAVDPIKVVIAPRMPAGVIAMPLLAAIFNAVGVIGGYIVGVVMIGVDSGAFWSQMQGGVGVWRDVRNGVVKSIVFGFAATFISLYQGYEAQPTPGGVSSATIRTVVYSSLALLGLDFMMTALMFN